MCPPKSMRGHTSISLAWSIPLPKNFISLFMLLPSRATLFCFTSPLRRVFRPGNITEGLRNLHEHWQPVKNCYRSLSAMAEIVKVTVDSKDPPYATLLTAEHLNGKTKKVGVHWGQHTYVDLPGSTCITGEMGVVRYLARKFPKSGMYGKTILQATEIDHWLDFCNANLKNGNSIWNAVQYLDNVLAPSTYLVGHSFTIADFAVWGALQGNKSWEALLKKGTAGDNINRWFSYCSSQANFKKVNSMVPKPNQAAKKTTDKKQPSSGMQTKMEEGGKFIDLPGAKQGEVVVRFPPEASGYLHIGHAKAALLNQYYKESYNGKLIMRFDDTNPAKENEHFEEVILEDIKMLHLTPDKFSRTSDYFDVCLKSAEKLIRDGNAYCDDTPAEEMKELREKREASKYRDQAMDKNLKMWQEMIKGSEVGLKCCVRAKIDYASDNGCLRDPVMYRCKPETHIATGDRYKVYPTYDLACPIVDSIEGVTHALRTTEYHDRDPLYLWVLEKLGMRQPHIYEYSRLAMMNTVLSKRKLTYLVEQGMVDGWNDARFPTVRGIIRRGMTIEGLKEFIIAQGSSRSNVHMEWDKIWTFNKKIIDPVAPRYTAILDADKVPVNIANASDGSAQYPLHPKNPDVGSKTVFYSNKIFIDGADAETFSENELVTFINWGNMRIKKLNKGPNGKVQSIDANLELENKDFKKTAKVTWLADHKDGLFTPTVCVQFEHIITKDVITKNDDFKDHINKNTRTDLRMLGDPELRNLKKGDIIQLQRRGYYICDEPFQDASRHSGREIPCVLFNIPDGHTKAMATSGSKAKSKEQAKNQASNQKQASAKQKRGIATSAVAAEKSSNVAPEEEQKCIDKISAQGQKVRDIKAAKASKEDIQKEVQLLLAAKAEYKQLTGKDYAPPSDNKAKKGEKEQKKENKKEAKKETMAPTASAASLNPEAQDLLKKISEQGEAVRNLKTGAAPKDQVDAAVKILLDLKGQYKTLTGEDVPGAGGGRSKKDKKEKKKDEGKKEQPKREQAAKKAEKQETKTEVDGAAGGKKITRLGLQAKKSEALSDWYSQVITKAEMIEYYDVSGCYILRPTAYGIWEKIQHFFDTEIKKLGVENCYFPMFVSHAALEKEKSHIADFAPEVAWVTKSGDSELAEPIAIRPTSETVMYPTYAKWVQSHRDLPIKLNQWCNIVRWEFKHPQPFLRTREFLWQEGHTAYATKEEACEEVHTILDLYAQVYTDLLAIPVVKGRKTEKEKFAGGDFTTTCEAYISASGRAIQGATSHHLGQNFSKMFDIVFEDPNNPESKDKMYVYQNSWGITTRTIGVMVMVHGDDIGLVVPPRVANIQVVIVPCGLTSSLTDDAKNSLYDSCKEFEKELKAAGIRAKADLRENYSPGWKFNHWELKGVPIRIELGPRDIQNKQFVAVRRDTLQKETIPSESKAKTLAEMLETIYSDMYKKAEKELEENLSVTSSWVEFCKMLESKKIIQSPFCGDTPCEEKIKKDSAREESTEVGAPSMGAKSLCIPFKQPAEIEPGTKCIHPDCKKPAKFYTLFGRSY